MSGMNRVFTLKEKSDALGDILSDALDRARLHGLRNAPQWERVVDVVTGYLDSLVVHHWTSEPAVLVLAAPMEPWIAEAIRFALVGRAFDGGDVEVKLTTLH